MVSCILADSSSVATGMSSPCFIYHRQQLINLSSFDLSISFSHTLDVGYYDKKHHLVFYVDGKSMRVRSDFNVFNCTNACSIHRITYVIEAGLRLLPVLHRVPLQHKRI